MESPFHGLPPLKRFRLLQQEDHDQENDALASFQLPAKKRKESRSPPAAESNTFCLPAKKRVWALQPNFSSRKTLYPIDLNVEYNPSFEEEKQTEEEEKIPSGNGENQSLEGEKEGDDEGEEHEGDGVESAVGQSTDGDPSDSAVPCDGREKQAEEEKKVPEEDGENQSQKEEEEGAEEEHEDDKIECPLYQSTDGQLSDPIVPCDGCEKQAEEDKKIPDGNGENQCPEDEKEEEEEEQEDDGIECAVCQSTDGDPSDPIVLCDGCDLMVHAICYGDPLVKGIPEGDWFCSQCLFSQSPQSEKDKVLSCCLCPAKGGALKPTRDGRWAHLMCALLVPEVFFLDPEGREGIDCSRVPPRRWERICYVCNSAGGCAIDCSHAKCPLAFHVTCGFKEELCIEYREGKNNGAIVAGFCKDHTELWKKQQKTGKFKIVAREEHEE
ncbi:uncharacterized protein LOC131157043 [Malania oleifera]|uniref:uncharacterized protein LOC131157043 n=1 Tax=Malania oleifera TaxID=397392 RepID=UPI0025AE7102|nr:uncharacterized protein LOC131157043 [Malania oleifera]